MSRGSHPYSEHENEKIPTGPVIVYYPSQEVQLGTEEGQVPPPSSQPSAPTYQGGQASGQQSVPQYPGGIPPGNPYVTIFPDSFGNDTDFARYITLRRMSATVKFLAIIDIAIAIFWFFSPGVWWPGLGVIFGLLGYYGAQTFSRPSVFLYMLWQCAFLGIRVAGIIVALKENNTGPNFSLSVVFMVFSCLLELIIIAYVYSFYRKIPRGGLEEFRRLQMNAVVQVI